MVNEMPTSGGVLNEIIDTPVFKDVLRGHLKGIEPTSSPDFVRDIMWQDLEVFLGVLGSLPSIINASIAAFSEILNQLGEKFPPQLLKAFIGSILNEIDMDAVKQCGNSCKSIGKEILEHSPEIESSLNAAATEITAKGINAFTQFINSINRNNPDALGKFVSGIAARIDAPALGKATQNLTHSVLDERPHLVGWLGRILLGRIKRYFRAKRERTH